MPPRYVYWTIIVDGQPTAFRSGSLEDIMPTFNRLKEKQPTAELKWWQNGQLWPSRHDAQDFMRARGERGRAKDPRQAGDRGPGAGARDPETGKPERAWNAKPEWKTRSSFKPRSPRTDDKPAWVPKDKSTFRSQPESRPADSGEKPSFARASSSAKALGDRSEGKPEWKPKGDRPSFAKAKDDRPAGQARSDRKPEWKPKGTFKPKEAGHATGWGEKPGWKPKGDKPSFAKASSYAKAPGDRSEGRPAWKSKPSGSAREQARSSFRPKSYTPSSANATEGRPGNGAARTRSSKARDQELDWKPKADSRPGGPNSGFRRGEPSDSPASDAPKRKWVPKAEYKKSLGIEAKKDSKWRPGGDHADPKQKYKDAKKAKWGRFKEAIRSRSAKPRKPKDE